MTAALIEPGRLAVDRDELAGVRIGSGLRSTPLTTEKSAVFAPMPSASVNTAMAAKPGD